MQADNIMSTFLQICANPAKQTIHEEVFFSISALLNGTCARLFSEEGQEKLNVDQ